MSFENIVALVPLVAQQLTKLLLEFQYTLKNTISSLVTIVDNLNINSFVVY